MRIFLLLPALLTAADPSRHSRTQGPLELSVPGLPCGLGGRRASVATADSSRQSRTQGPLELSVPGLPCGLGERRAFVATADDRTLEELRAALDRTAAGGYAFEVKGRWERTGEVKAPGIVTSRMKHYQSARHGDEILVKGPEGLWRTPEERLGEKVEKGEDPDAPAIVRTLQKARAPHEILQELLALVGKGREPQDREVDGLMCKRYVLPFPEEALRKSLDEQMARAVQAGELERPDKVRWSSARGSVAVYLAKGLLRKVKDERQVEIEYKVPDLPPRVKKYRLEWEYDYSSWGKVTLTIPKEIRERLKIKDE